MGIRSKINWIITGASLRLLKRSLQKRVQGEAAAFLQPIPIKGTGIFNRIDFILDECRNKKILHVGFSDHPFTAQRVKDGTLLHLRLKEKAAGLFGLDADDASVKLYTSLTGDTNVLCGDISIQYPPEAIGFKPELVLLGEVLEHLKDPHTAAAVLHQSFPHGTKILVTVPNYTALDNAAAALHQTESVHPDHYWYFSPYTLTRLFDAQKFTLEQLHFGMYYQPGKKINAVLQQQPFYGDCIMAVFSINKNEE